VSHTSQPTSERFVNIDSTWRPTDCEARVQRELSVLVADPLCRFTVDCNVEVGPRGLSNDLIMVAQLRITFVRVGQAARSSVIGCGEPWSAGVSGR
jgi:hypothetical protein